MKISRDKIKQLVEQEVERRSADVEKVSKKMDTFSTQLEPLLDRINTRVEFEQFLKDAIKISSANVKGSDIMLGMMNIIKQLRKEVK
tara:strand:- start:23 stop:283 length:261 start_codon:yes stop_codon:yes gene_type:complete